MPLAPTPSPAKNWSSTSSLTTNTRDIVVYVGTERERYGYSIQVVKSRTELKNVRWCSPPEWLCFLSISTRFAVAKRLRKALNICG